MNSKQAIPDFEALERVSEDEVPKVVQLRQSKWLELFKKIPEGEGVKVTQADTTVNLSYVRTVVKRLIKKKQLSEKYYATQRTIGNKKAIYVVHSTKEQK